MNAMKGLEQSKRLMDDPRVAEMLPPEQMEQYQKAFGMGMTMLYDQKFIPNAVKMLQSAPSPAAGIGNVAATLGSQIYMRAAQAGDQIAANVLPLAGMDLVREVAEFGEKFADMGEVGDNVVEDAFLIASDGLRSALGQNAPDLSQEAGAVMQSANPDEVAMMQGRGQKARLPESVRPQRGLGGMM